MDALEAAFDAAAEDDEVRVVVLRGSGRAFCAGYDLNQDAEEGTKDAAEWHRELDRDTKRLLRILENPKPVIASVHSYCLAGGTDLMLACDLAVASDDAVFGYVDIRFGSGVVSMFLPWVVGVRAAKELILTGQDRVPAAEALRIGLVNRVVPRDELEGATMALADEIAKNEPFVVRTMKASINRVWQTRRPPGGARRQHGAGRDDRDGQPARPGRVPPDHPRGGSEGRDRLARRAVPEHRVIYGLAAALGWGLSDLWAAISGRRIGSGRTVVVAQVAAGVVVTLLVLIVRPDLSGIPTVAPWLIPNAFLGAAAFATLYKGLQLGPIAVVSPVLASYAVVPVLLSVVLLGETLGGLQVVGVAVTIAGAALTSTDPKALRAGTRTKPAGLPWAIVSTLLFGVATYVMGWAAKEAGFLPSLWFGRLTMMTVFLLAALVLWLRSRSAGEVRDPVSPSMLRLAVLVGVMELVGTIAYARGAEVGLVSIVTAASATYPLIPVFGGVVLLHERPVPTQYLGIAMVIGGLLLLGVA